jgi:hypothetical protein
MQANFETMTIAELKAYALSHREEIEPLRELYRRCTPDSEVVWFKAPQTKEDEEQQMALLQKVIAKKKL